MSATNTVRIFLEPSLRQSAEAGQHSFIAKLVSVLGRSQFGVEFRSHGDSAADFSLSHMRPPVGDRGLVFRRVYHYPFWQIYQTAERWRWDTGTASFDPGTIDRTEAGKFFEFWQNRFWGDLPQQTRRDGYVYVPLQGRLLDKRSFQQSSPMEMIEHCLTNLHGKPVIAALHPKETYSVDELAALEALAGRHKMLEVQRGGMETLLQGCDCVVTQNSGRPIVRSSFESLRCFSEKLTFTTLLCVWIHPTSAQVLPN